VHLTFSLPDYAETEYPKYLYTLHYTHLFDDNAAIILGLADAEKTRLSHPLTLNHPNPSYHHPTFPPSQPPAYSAVFQAGYALGFIGTTVSSYSWV
jgi:hypothetical protein